MPPSMHPLPPSKRGLGSATSGNSRNASPSLILHVFQIVLWLYPEIDANRVFRMCKFKGICGPYRRRLGRRSTFVRIPYTLSDGFQGDMVVVMAVLKNYGGTVLEFVPAEFKTKGFVLLCVKDNGGALQFASPELKGDKEVVIAAVQQKGRALQFASPELK